MASDPKERALIAVYCHHASFIAAFRAVAQILWRSGADDLVGADELFGDQAREVELSLEADDTKRYQSFWDDLKHHHGGYMTEIRLAVDEQLTFPPSHELVEPDLFTNAVNEDVARFGRKLAELQQQRARLSQVTAFILDTLEHAHEGLGSIAGVTTRRI